MMNEYDKLCKSHQKDVNEFPFGFAFSDEQFVEMMKGWGLCHGRDGKPTINDCKQILKLPFGGGFVQKKDRDAMHEMFARHDAEMKAAIDGDKDGTGFIFQMFLSEMRNHEYGYTGDLTDTLGALGLTGDDIEANPALKAGLKKAQEVALNEDCF